MRDPIEFQSGGVTCRGWLYLPDQTHGPCPVVVMGHGLGATKELRLDTFAEIFRAAGYACLVFDYRHFGESDGQPRQLLDIRRQQDDWRAAIHAARAHDQLDQRRVILWGTSFSGGHVLQVAAGDPRIAAVISQCPFTDGLASALAVKPLTSLKVTGRAVRDLVAKYRGQAPVMIPLAGGPRDTALMTAPDVVPGYRAMIPEGLDFPDQVSARVALSILTYRPGRYARQVHCPILFCICDADSVAPAGPSRRYAQQAPRAEIEHYPEGHFDIYFGEAFGRVSQRQLEFLRTHVPVQPSSGHP